ncbi:MAG: helix-turn-helix transcriptional regulator [Caldisericaceae bacterium]
MFKKNDARTIESLKNVVKGLAAFLGDDAEVVLHSLEDMNHSIVAIENGHITGRVVGSSLTDAGRKIIKDVNINDKPFIGPYRSISPTGKILRSVTIPIKNPEKEVIGFICINMDIAKFLQLEKLVSDFTEFSREKISNGDLEKTGDNIELEDLRRKIFEEVLVKSGAKGEIPLKERNKFIIEELYRRDFFRVKDSIDFVAQKLGVSIFTVYNYLRELKFEKNERR